MVVKREKRRSEKIEENENVIEMNYSNCKLV
jgi:hypothetical protein